MKIEFIKRGAATRLILIFAGWSTDARYYNDCVADGWDTAVVSDYRDLSMPDLPAQYTTVYIFAYSLGVWAAAQCPLKSAARIAICGSEIPVSDEYGIPKAVYMATADGISAESLKKFHLRMAGSRTELKRIEPSLPISPDIKTLQEELYAIASQQDIKDCIANWDRAYIAKQDRIFPEDNLKRFWNLRPNTDTIILDASHAVEIPAIIRDVIPDTSAIGESFSDAKPTYNLNATVQAEICRKIGEIINDKLSGTTKDINLVLEIGVGSGLLTDIWRNILSPTDATFVDLLQMSKFGIAEKEEYIVGDAEEWLKNSSAKYDIILSASTIQWFADPVGFIETVKEHLNPGGFAIISTFTKGNLHQLDAIRPCPLIYHTAEEYKSAAGVDVEEWERTLKFSSSREMLLHLRNTGVSPRRSFTAIPLTSFPTALTYRPLILCVDSKR